MPVEESAAMILPGIVPGYEKALDDRTSGLNIATRVTVTLRLRGDEALRVADEAAVHRNGLRRIASDGDADQATNAPTPRLFPPASRGCHLLMWR
jgi:hypothetical protein